MVTGKIEKINIEDSKRRSALSSILPKQIITFEHTLPLKILAFSDYEVHDFKPLLEYVKNLKEKPDIIVYAGDGIMRFGPLPLNHLTFGCFNENHEYPPMLEGVCISYENDCEYSLSFGFILRFPKKLNINIMDKIKQIKAVYSIIQTFNKSSSRSLQTLKNLIQELPVQVKMHVSEGRSTSDEKIISLVDAQTQLEIYRFRMSREELQPESFFLINVSRQRLIFVMIISIYFIRMWTLINYASFR